eukprot:gene16118-22261_t
MLIWFATLDAARDPSEWGGGRAELRLLYVAQGQKVQEAREWLQEWQEKLQEKYPPQQPEDPRQQLRRQQELLQQFQQQQRHKVFGGIPNPTTPELHDAKIKQLQAAQKRMREWH